MLDLNKYIEINTEKRFGKPILKGTRISVYDVLNWLSNGMSKKEIVTDFPELNDNMLMLVFFLQQIRKRICYTQYETSF